MPLRIMVFSVWFVFRTSAMALPPSVPSLFPEASSYVPQVNRESKVKEGEGVERQVRKVDKNAFCW